ncbi:MAG: aldo/keto reductase [Vulcanimicrobiaceae bacterium]
MASEAKTTSPSLGGPVTIGGDLTVHRMGFGAMRITGKGIWGPPPDRTAAIALLRHVVASGVNFIDTADSYGPDVSEELIAEALHPYPSDLVIATKGGLVRTGPDQWPIDARPERLRACVDGSLRRLKCERIDLYQLHRIDPKVPVAESLGALVEMQRAGKIRHIGISQTSLAEYEQCNKIATIASVQNLYNVEDRSADDVVTACERDGVAFLPWFPLGGSGKQKHAVVARIAAARGVSANRVALAWLLARSRTMLPIPGTSSIPHFDDNIAAGVLELTPDERVQLA